jgi:hypothetical protein
LPLLPRLERTSPSSHLSRAAGTLANHRPSLAAEERRRNPTSPPPRVIPYHLGEPPPVKPCPVHPPPPTHTHLTRAFFSHLVTPQPPSRWRQPRYRAKPLWPFWPVGHGRPPRHCAPACGPDFGPLAWKSFPFSIKCLNTHRNTNKFLKFIKICKNHRKMKT